MNPEVPAYGTPPGHAPSHAPGPHGGAPGGPHAGGPQFTCPKCRGTMRSYERNGLTIEQCETCRGIFLDFGELEALTRLEAQLSQPPLQAPQAPPQPQYVQQAPPPGYGYGPGWGQHGGHYYRKGGFTRLFFST